MTAPLENEIRAECAALADFLVEKTAHMATPPLIRVGFSQNGQAR